ncbi:MAG: acyltransferase [Porphyromonadaceae bacterium]|nr:acyltransferase [Porphyromonadaceae bacterium]
MISLQEHESRLFTAIRFPLIILVVFVHVLPFSVQSVDPTLTIDENVYRIISEAISHAWGNVAVPTFFLISGYYFWGRLTCWSEAIYYGQLSKRLKTLLIPYLLWNLLLVFLMALKGYGSQLFNLPYGEAELKALGSNNLVDFMLMPVDFPLWYLRDLMYVSLLSPLIYYLIRTLPVVSLGVFVFSQVIVPSFWDYLLPTTAFSYFGLGAWFALRGQSLLAFVRRFRWPFIFCFAVLPLSLWVPDPDSPISTFSFFPLSRGLVMLGTFGVISLFDWLFSCFSGFMAYCIRMSSVVFFIYAAHLVYLENWIKGAFSRSLFYTNGYGKLVAYFLTPILTIFVCLLIYRLMRRYAPRMLGILTGNRH